MTKADLYYRIDTLNSLSPQAGKDSLSFQSHSSTARTILHPTVDEGHLGSRGRRDEHEKCVTQSEPTLGSYR